LPKTNVIGTDEKAGVPYLVVLDELAQKLRHEGQVFGDRPLGGNAPRKVANLEAKLHHLLQSRPLTDQRAKQAFTFGALELLKIDFGRLCRGKVRRSLCWGQVMVTMIV
jgi:hypothetical protein